MVVLVLLTFTPKRVSFKVAEKGEEKIAERREMSRVSA